MKQIDIKVQSQPHRHIRDTPFFSPSELTGIAPGCVKAMKSHDCEAKCELAWQPTCPREKAAYRPLVNGHSRGVGTIHTKAFMAGDNVPGRLTKTFLMVLPAGSYLVSNMGSYKRAYFEEVVARSEAMRLAQWARIVFDGANSRRCYVYTSKKKYEALRALHDAERAMEHAESAGKFAAKYGHMTA